MSIATQIGASGTADRRESRRDLLLTEEPCRRGFLRSLIAAPVAALATHRLILPGHDFPQERARRAWREFSAAMNEITAEDHGWVLMGGEKKPFRHLDEGNFINPRAIRYEPGAQPRAPRLIIERHREIIL